MSPLGRLVIAIGLFLVAFRPGQAPPRAQQATDGPPPGTAVMGSSERHDTSPPLANITPQRPASSETPVEVPLGRPPRGFSRQDPFDAQIDPVVQNFPSTSVMPSPLLTFEGIGYSQTGVVPADTNGDIGPNHYVQTVNAAFAIWDRKTGNLLQGPANINTLWKDFGGLCETTNRGQPIVLYDHLADRWLMSQLANTDTGAGPTGPFYQCIAISKGADPLGEWHRYAFRVSDSKLNDHPKLGVWPDAYYMSADQVAYPGGTWVVG